MSKKQYVITSITLGCIAAASAGLIGLTNLITRDQIAQNEKNKINSGIVEIFGKDAKISNEDDLSGYTYVSHYYSITGEQNGYAYLTSGKNDYGKITLIVGFDGSSGGFKAMYVVVNEQTYASTLVENYIDPVNKQEKDYETDVQCGATYGAKLIREMINEATQVNKNINSVDAGE